MTVGLGLFTLDVLGTLQVETLAAAYGANSAPEFVRQLRWLPPLRRFRPLCLPKTSNAT